MNTITLHYFNEIEEQNDIKIINFSSSIVQAIANIPHTIVLILLAPVVFLVLLVFLPIANVLLWYLQKKLNNALILLKKDINTLSYEDAKSGYEFLSKIVSRMYEMDKDLASSADSILFKGFYSKFCNILHDYSAMRDTLVSILYLKVEKTEPLSEKEKETYKAFNDIWGDDNDEVYARHTHLHLTKKAL